MGIYVKNINKKFDEIDVLKNINLEVKPGELVALLGPSGSGKTTLLRIIAGLELADSGDIFLNNKDVNKKHVKDRNVGFVFQHYALFKNMTVFDNVAFGLKVRPRAIRPSKEQIHEKVMKLLKLIHLSNFHDRYPSQLSGGQRQRVALARALAVEPKFLLLDEPFGALDAKVRKELRSWLRKLHNTIDVTTLFVTHDQQEAMEVADKIVIMSNGQIEQIGTPDEVYTNPSNIFVYDFFDNYNQFRGWQDEDGEIYVLDENSSETTANQDKKPSPQTKLLSNSYPEAINLLSKISFGFFPKKPSPEHKKSTKKTKKDPNAKIIDIYARPYEMEVIKRKNLKHKYIKAKVVHINIAGFSVKLELESEHGKIIQAELLKESVDKMKISKHDWVYVRPLTVKLFNHNYQPTL